MKRFLFFFIVLYSAGVSIAQDSVIRGGFVEYRYLGNQVYEAKLTLYATCPYPDMSPYLGCKVGADTLQGDSLTFVQEKDITGIPAHCAVQSKCSGDTNAVYGVMRLTWTRIFDLDTHSQCTVLFFAYAGKRDAGITTGSAGQVFYIDSWLDQCQAPGSSSPGMAGKDESGYSIYNQDNFLNFGVGALGDFDSVSYAVTYGRVGPGNSIVYLAPYSYTRPVCYYGFCASWQFPCPIFPWHSGFQVDPLLGLVLHRASSNCFGPIVMEISMWKRDSTGMKIVSTLTRELAVDVVTPGNKIPKIAPPFSGNACAGQQFCFNISTEDDDAQDSVFLSVESELPGLSYQINHSQTRFAKAQVCWTPDSSHISNTPYTFIVKAKDNHCDFPGTITRSFAMFVRESPKAQTLISQENCGRVILSAVPEKNYTGMFVQWKVFDSVGNQVALSTKASDTLILQPGKYRSVFSISTYAPCTQTYIDSFEVENYNQVAILAAPLSCFGDTVKAQSVNTENHSFSYEWFKQAGSSPHFLNADTAEYVADTTHYLHLTVRWGLYCQTSDSVRIEVWKPRPELSGSYLPFCLGDTATLKVAHPSDSFVYEWNTGENTDSIRVSQAGWYRLSTTYFSACVQVDSIEVIPNPLPVIHLSAPDSICPGDTADVQASLSGTGPFDLLWQDSTTGTSINSTGGWSVLRVSDGNGCRNSDSLVVSFFEIPAPDTNSFSVCRGHGFSLLAADSLGAGVQYSFGDTGNYVIPTVSGLAEARVTSKEGCKAVYPIEIVVNERPDPAYSYSVLTERNLLFIPNHQWNAFYAWDFGDSTTSSQMIVNHAFTSNGPHQVTLTVTDRTSACTDSSAQQVSFSVGLNPLESADIQVFPNPFGASFRVQSRHSGHFRIYSTLGSLVAEGELRGMETLEIHSEDWMPGVYFMYVETEGGIYAGKIFRR